MFYSDIKPYYSTGLEVSVYGELQLREEFIVCSVVVQLGAAPSASNGRIDRNVLQLGRGPLLSYIGAGE